MECENNKDSFFLPTGTAFIFSLNRTYRNPCLRRTRMKTRASSPLPWPPQRHHRRQHHQQRRVQHQHRSWCWRSTRRRCSSWGHRRRVRARRAQHRRWRPEISFTGWPRTILYLEEGSDLVSGDVDSVIREDESSVGACQFSGHFWLKSFLNRLKRKYCHKSSSNRSRWRFKAVLVRINSSYLQWRRNI